MTMWDALAVLRSFVFAGVMTEPRAAAILCEEWDWVTPLDALTYVRDGAMQ